MKKEDFIIMHISNYCVAAKIKSVTTFTKITNVDKFTVEDATIHAELVWDKIPEKYKTL